MSVVQPGIVGMPSAKRGAVGLFYKDKVLLSGLCVAVENAEHPLSLLEGNDPKPSPACAVGSRQMASGIIL